MLVILTVAAALWVLRARVTAARTIAVLVVLATLIALGSSRRPIASPTPPPAAAPREGLRQTLLITLDTLRPDFLSSRALGNGPPTPQIDALARDGALFETALAPSSWTLPSVATILTGLPPSVHGVLRKGSRLPAGVTTLAERLDAAGYATAAFVSNIFLRPAHNLSQGFRHYEAFPKTGSLGTRVLEGSSVDRFPAEASAAYLTGLAVRWLERNHDRDFFLWVHYFDPHIPYGPPENLLGPAPAAPTIGRTFSRLRAVRAGYFVPTLAERAWIRRLYAGEIRFVDGEIGRLIGRLRGFGLYEDSLIILTSDHGEEFWEHGGWEHGHSLYEELLRVPLIIKPPLPFESRRIEEAVAIEQVASSILELCGLDEGSRSLPGPSLGPLLWGGEPPATPIAILGGGTMYYEDLEFLREGATKYIRATPTGREELYDLAADPQERTNLASLDADRLERARRAFHERVRADERLRERLGFRPEADRRIDGEALDRLRSLGYAE